MKDNAAFALLRARLMRDLPGDIDRAHGAYHRMADYAQSTDDPKEFSARQTACKAALGHLECLIRLMRWAVVSDGASGHDMGESSAGGAGESDGESAEDGDADGVADGGGDHPPSRHGAARTARSAAPPGRQQSAAEKMIAEARHALSRT